MYIDLLQDRAPPSVERLLRTRICNHLAPCIAELSHALGRLDPSHPGTRPTADSIRKVIGGIKTHRVHTPGAAVWCEAGIVAGLLFRLGNYPKGQELRCLNDAVLYLDARLKGMTVLTRNIADFDLIDQLARGGKVVVYRISEQTG